MSTEDANHATIEVIRNLAKEIGIPQKLHEIQVKSKDLVRLATAAFNDVCTSGNPREVIVQDILAIYQEAF
jgi:lactaldehyde reductase